MPTSRLYSYITESYHLPTDNDARLEVLIDIACHVAEFAELEDENMPMYFEMIEQVGSVEIFYDYGADYYFYRETNDDLPS